MDVNHHSLVVLDAGAEVLPDHNVPVSTELNQEVFRFEILTRSGLARLTFSLSLPSIRWAASSGFLSLTVRWRKYLKISHFFIQRTFHSSQTLQISHRPACKYQQFLSPVMQQL